MAVISSLLVLLLLSGLNTAIPAPSESSAAQSYAGFSSIKYFFNFGDSYGRTGFEVTGTQPSASNPLGNPDFPGVTSANGENWVGFITSTYNKSQILTYNFAYSGATVTKHLVSSSRDIEYQVNTEFIPYYVNKQVKWTASDSLFGFWIGINDVGKSYEKQNDTLIASIFDKYQTYVEQVYSAGARNFLFLNVPPVDRAPKTTLLGSDAEKLEKSDITEWNTRLKTLISTLTSKHSDATVVLYDTNTLFNTVIDSPKTYTETSSYTDTTSYWSKKKTGDENTFLWYNSLHPTTPMHKLLAKQIAAALK